MIIKTYEMGHDWKIISHHPNDRKHIKCEKCGFHITIYSDGFPVYSRAEARLEQYRCEEMIIEKIING